VWVAWFQGRSCSATRTPAPSSERSDGDRDALRVLAAAPGAVVRDPKFVARDPNPHSLGALKFRSRRSLGHRDPPDRSPPRLVAEQRKVSPVRLGSRAVSQGDEGHAHARGHFPPEPDAAKLATDPGYHHQSWCGGKQPCACTETWKAGGWRDYLPENDPVYQAGYAAGLRAAQELISPTRMAICVTRERSFETRPLADRVRALSPLAALAAQALGDG